MKMLKIFFIMLFFNFFSKPLAFSADLLETDFCSKILGSAVLNTDQVLDRALERLGNLKEKNIDKYKFLFEILDQASKKSGYDVLNLELIMEKGSKSEQKAILKQLKKYDLSRKGLTPRQAKNLISDLYVYSKTGLKHKSKWIGKVLPLTVRQRIEQHVEIELVSHNLITAAQSLGLLRQGGIFEKMREISHKYANVLDMITTISLNAVTILHLGMPSKLPSINVVGMKPVPQDFVDKIREQGFNAVYPDLLKYYGKSAKFDQAWRVGQRLYAGFTSVVLVSMFMHVMPTLEFAVGLATVSKQDIIDLQERTFNPEKIKQEQFESWKEAFNEFNGRYPDPEKFPEDREEWDQVYKNIQSLTDEDLKIDFSEKK